MPFRSHNKTVVTEETHPTLMTRLRGRNANTQTVKTTTTVHPNGTTAPAHPGRNNNTRTRKHHFGRDAVIGGGVGVAGYEAEKHHKNKRARRGYGTSTTVGNGGVSQRRHVSMGDKISGALMRMKGSILHRPGVKAAGTRRMHGTDGRGAHRVY